MLIDMSQMPSLFCLLSESITPVKGTNYDSRPTPVGTSRAEKGDSSGVGKGGAVHTRLYLSAAKDRWLLRDSG